MKLGLPLAFRFTWCLLKGRGTGMMDGYKSGFALNAKMSRKFIKLMHRTVGLPYTYKLPGACETTTTIIKEKATTSRQKPNHQKAKRFLEVIMQHVDEAYTSGELGDINELPEFVVSKAKISDDMSELRLYWEAGGCAEDNQEMQRKLEEISPKLRRCLHNLNLGNIPPIVFIMDDSRYRFDLLEEKLDIVKKASNETSVYDDHTDSFVINETKT